MDSQSEQNIKMLKDIKDYYEAHTSDFKQVFFSPASVTASATKPTGASPIKSIPGQHTMQTCSYNASLEGASYFSLTPAESGLFKCDIYAGTDISNIPVSKITKVMWQMPIPTDTSYVCLDMIGNLNAYNDKNQVVATIFKSQDPADKRTVPGRYRLILVDNRDNRLQPLRIRNTKTNAAYVVLTVNPEHIVKNDDWANESNIVHYMSNETQQTGNRQISIDKITKTVSLVSNDYRYKLHIKDNALVLEATLKDKRQFYKTNADEKVGKLYYASTYPEYKFLKEVPGSMQTVQSGNYTTYDEVYPDKNMKYDIKTGTNCTKECDTDNGCRAVYTVVDSVTKQTMCFVSKDAPSFNAKPPGSNYDSSVLNVKNPVINSKDPEYSNAEYISNGYNTGFASYNVSGLLEPNFIPGPYGTPYVQQLKQKIAERTIGNPTKAESTTENMTTIDRALSKLNNIEQSVSRHEKYQTDISNNVRAIQSQISSIDTIYTDMSNNSFYKFTGTVPLMESEDTSIEKALINDNKVYMAEQRNVYAIAGLTMATLIVMAIIM